MAFKQTQWAKSTVTAEGYPKLEEGEQYLKIKEATYDDTTDPENPFYQIVMDNVETGARGWFKYWTSGNGKSARSHRGAYISLGKALAGVEIGEPWPDDIVGGVVVADVKFTDQGYPRCYHFSAAPQEIVETYSDIDQYFDGSTDTELIH